MPDTGKEIPLALDEQLCFALYAASRAMMGEYRPLLAELGLTFPQFLVMLVLWEDGTATVGGLGEKLHLDSGTLSPLLKRLESLGLVSRRRRPDDERSVEVSPTGRGRDLRARVECIPPVVAGATGLSGDEIADLRRMLHRLIGNMRPG